MYTTFVNILESVRLINETNITIEVFKVVIEPGNAKLVESFFKYALPLLSVIFAATMAIYSMRSNSRNLFIQLNKDRINQNLDGLEEIIKGGNTQKISYFIKNDGIYLPERLKMEINNYIEKKSNNELLDKEEVEYILGLITKYIYQKGI